MLQTRLFRHERILEFFELLNIERAARKKTLLSRSIEPSNRRLFDLEIIDVSLPKGSLLKEDKVKRPNRVIELWPSFARH